MDEESVKTRIRGWMDSNRQGENAKAPCFWTLYPINSISSSVNKGTSVNCNNLHIEDLEGSVNYLLESMSNTIHVKYFAVRLRDKKSDQGTINNFHNPYYQANSRQHNSSINGIPSTNDMNSIMIGFIREQAEERNRQAEERYLLMMQMINQKNELQTQFETYKKEAEIAKLKEENQALKNAPNPSPLLEFLEGIKPEVTELIKHKISGQIPYTEVEEEQGNTPTEDNKKEILNQGLELLKNNTAKPEEWVFKLAFVLNALKEEEAKQLLSMLQIKYQSLKNAQQNG